MIFSLLALVLYVILVSNVLWKTIIDFREGGKQRVSWTRRLLELLSTAIFLLGLTGFMLPFIAGGGVLNFLGAYEYPPGYAERVVQLSDGTLLVPKREAARIQVYDRDKQFMHSWYVEDAGGGLIDVHPRTDGTLDVYTARGRNHYVFDRNGGLLWSGKWSGRYPGPIPEARRVWIPTLWILMPLAHPMLALVVAILGAAAMQMTTRVSKGDAQLQVPPSQQL